MNSEAFLEELPVLESIYGEENVKVISNTEESVTANFFLVKPEDTQIGHGEETTFHCQVDAPWLTSSQIIECNKVIEDYLAGLTELDSFFEALEKIREIVPSSAYSEYRNAELDSGVVEKKILQETKDNVSPFRPSIEEPDDMDIGPSSSTMSFSYVTADNPIVDRKSHFHAYATYVTSPSEACAFVEFLKSVESVPNRAYHNIMAYRVLVPSRSQVLTAASQSPSTLLQQDHDSDGETAAGSRLQYLLNILKVENVCVVVSRIFGGIELGPVRFKHINSMARAALDKLQESRGSSK